MIVHAADFDFGKIDPPPGTPVGTGPEGLGKFIAFGVQMFFLVPGIAALIYLLRGAFAWITSGGDKEKLQKAQAMLRNAIVGLLLIFVVLSVMVTLEDFVFSRKICFGIRAECPIKLPNVNAPPTGSGGVGGSCTTGGDCASGNCDVASSRCAP